MFTCANRIARRTFSFFLTLVLSVLVFGFAVSAQEERRAERQAREAAQQPSPQASPQASPPSAQASPRPADETKRPEEEARPRDPMSTPTFNGLRLRSIGPAFTSGRISGFAVDPNNPSRYYVAVASGGVWKTINAGITWTPIFDNEVPIRLARLRSIQRIRSQFG